MTDLREVLILTLVPALSRQGGTQTLETEACDVQPAVYSYKFANTEQTDQLNASLAPLLTRNVPRKQ